MERLAVHVIATAAVTVTLATVPMLFPDACHASSSAAAQSATTRAATHASSTSTAPAPAVAVLPALSEQAQTLPAASAPAGTAFATPSAPGTAPTPPAARPDRGRLTLPVLPDRPCADARQVGHTAYARYRGTIAFSVRQYFSPSCHAYYGYSYAWHRFRGLRVPFDVGVAVYDSHSDAIDGAKAYVQGKGGPSYWSAAVAAESGRCTQGEGHFFYYPSGARGGFIEGDTMTGKACA
jgi:hypothetical protein